MIQKFSKNFFQQDRLLGDLPSPFPKIVQRERKMDASFSNGSTKKKDKILLIASSRSLPNLSRQGIREAFHIQWATEWTGLKMMIANLKPSLLLLDLALPQLGGIGALSIIRYLSPLTNTIVLTDTPNDSEAVYALKGGAKGYCHIKISPSLLMKAINSVERGEVWVGHSVISRLIEELSFLSEVNSPNQPDVQFDLLTHRETEIANLIGIGLCNKEIAVKLNITERTVKAHLSAIFQKLKVSDRVRLALSVAEISRSNNHQRVYS